MGGYGSIELYNGVHNYALQCGQFLSLPACSADLKALFQPIRFLHYKFYPIAETRAAPCPPVLYALLATLTRTNFTKETADR